MKHTYAPFLLMAGLLANNIATAQMPVTVQSAANRAAYQAKLTPGIPHTNNAMRGGLPNDDCAGAIVMTVGTSCTPTASDMGGATESMPAATCSGFTATAANDVWFSFTATATTTVVEVTGGVDIDPVLELFAGSCADLGSIGCIDGSLLGATETFAFATVVGTTYYYRTYYWPYTAAPTAFDFTTCVYSPTNIPANDLCSGADNQSLSMGGSVTFTGDNTGALDTELLGAATVWHSFTTTECANLALSYCGTTPAFANGFTSLWSDCPPTTAVGSVSFNFTDCPDGNVTIYYENVPAGTYYYGVLTEDGSVGPYTLTVAASPCPATLGNDECDGALALTSNASCLQIGFTTDNATESLPAILCAGFTSPSANDVWFSFVATSTSQTIGVVGFNAADAMIELFSGTCAGLTSLACADATFPASATETTTEQLIQTGLTVGTTYYVRVYDYAHGSTDHLFEICVTEGEGTNIGIEENTGGDAWSIYPNPSNGQFNLNYTGVNATGEIEVFDLTGRVVYSERTALANGTVRNIDLRELSAGTYNVRLTVNNVRSEQRLMVK